MDIATVPYYAFSGDIGQQIQITYPINRNKSSVDLYSGSGGKLISFFSTAISGEKDLGTKEIETSNAVTEIIDYIALCFDLTKEELAPICQVQSRKTIYNWLDGSSIPRASTMARLFDLFLIAKAWKQTNLPSNYKVLSRPVFAGQSVLDLLKEPVLNRDKILFVGSRLFSQLPLQTNFKDPFA